MVNVLEMAQKMLILADAINTVAKSEDLAKANECIRRNTRGGTERSHGGIALARDLMSCRHDFESCAKSLLEYSNLELHQMSTCYPDEDVQGQINDELFERNEAHVLLETKKYGLDVREDLIRKHVLVENGTDGRIPDYEELLCDEQASEALDGLSTMIANLNMMFGLANQINSILREINEVKTGSGLSRYLLKYVQEIVCTRSRTYQNMCDRLKMTSKYSFKEAVIWSFCEAGYKGKDLMELLDFDICAKPCLTFGEMPSYILFNRLDGSTCMFVP